MSLFAAPLVEFTLEKHPDADSLSIAKVGEWQCIVRTEDFANQTLGVYLPLDAIADKDHPLLSFLQGKKVKTVKLRGIISQGVLLSYSKVVSYMKDVLGMSDGSVDKVSVLGKDFAGILRVKKHYDVVMRGSGTAEAGHELFDKYTDIENIKNFVEVIPYGEDVHISEKLHGTSARYALIDGVFLLGSRKRQLKLDADKKTVWHDVAERQELLAKLKLVKEMLELEDSVPVAIYGEIVGPGVQDLKYGQDRPKLFVYDIKVGHHYLNPEVCSAMCNSIDLEKVPEIKVGPFMSEDLNLRLGNSVLDSHVREGIVVKPLINRYDRKLGRVILKVISEDYYLRNNATDYVYDSEEENDNRE